MNLLRDKDLIFGGDDLEHLFTLKKFPVFMGCLEDKNSSKDLYEDFTLDISKSSGVVQVRKLIDLEVLYDSEHSSGTVGKIWHDHHKEFASFIASRTKPEKVFEIGGLHGILAKYYSEKNNTLSWVIVEPNPIPVEGCPAKFIKGFFGDDFSIKQDFEAYVHSHFFEHIYDPNAFVKKLDSFIPTGKDLFFSIPNIKEMIKRKYTNALNFEHTYYLTEELAIFLMESNGFELLSKQKFMDDHSIFFHFKKKSTEEKCDLLDFENKYIENKRIMQEWYEHHSLEANKLVEHITKTDSEIYLFGAHVFSQTLLNFGLDEKYINSILDNDSAKHNKRLYGTDLIVRSPEILREELEPVIILRAGVYNEEIKHQILNDINPSSVFF